VRAESVKAPPIAVLWPRAPLQVIGASFLAGRMLAQSLRCSIWQAVPSSTCGSAITDSYCLRAVNASGSFQCLIGQIIGHEGLVNCIEIANIIHHRILPKICPVQLLLRWTFGAVLYVTQNFVSPRLGLGHMPVASLA
jgi:hypothetical protein